MAVNISYCLGIWDCTAWIVANGMSSSSFLMVRVPPLLHISIIPANHFWKKYQVYMITSIRS